MSYFKVAVDWEVPWILNLAFLCFLLNTYTPGLVLPCTDSTAHNDLEWLIEVVKNTNITDISVHWDVWNWDVWKWLLIFVLPLRWLIFVDIWVKSLRWVILSDISVNYTEMSEIWTHLSESTHITFTNTKMINTIRHITEMSEIGTYISESTCITFLPELFSYGSGLQLSWFSGQKIYNSGR